MNLRKLASSVALAIISAGVGYSLSALSRSPLSLHAGGHDTPLDAFVFAASFSEVENSKALLDAECARFITELRVKWLPAIKARDVAGSRQSGHQFSPAAFTDSLRELERKIEEFKGSEQELFLVGELLTILRIGKEYNQWLDTYLRVLYEHPTHQIVGRWTQDAVAVSLAIGRESEVLDGFRHVAGIPFDFGGKQSIEQALANIRPSEGNFLAHAVSY